MSRPRIYISGALTTAGDIEHNVAVASNAFRALVESGYSPLCPHLSYYAEKHHHCKWPHQTWIDIDLEWVAMSEAVYRILGPSVGADLECEHARRLGIPVFSSLQDLESWRDDEWRRDDNKPALNAPSGDQRFHAKLRSIATLHDRKQADYGKAGDAFANVRASQEFGIAPWLGAVVRLNDKVSRLKSFALKGELKNESILDSFRDIAVYALIAEILYEEECGRST
ncbi:MAG: hypothetical protein FJY55_15010 [Betaproteobacteria bacterium]|nr:hypothetical protein [Betaproteobacteria bacterium]